MARKAAILMEDGGVEDVATGEELTFEGLAAGTYRIALYHKSHLPLLECSSSAISIGELRK